ncbi:hypothetical protein CVT26_003739 [Gymnopilus dilepis]|uniref:Uncharacterized protein n=1 Tax=Gymnopilus dilepis TaxID=231916 RepID=A0A409X197_9AGAR|nr:hypothetical protein CVT26_003739 [Gymnopilus dilepis]
MMDSTHSTRSSPRVASELPSRLANALPVSRASSLRSEDGRARLYSDVVSSRSPVRGGKVPGRVATGADGRVDDVPHGNDKCIFGYYYPKSGRTALDLDNRSDSEIPWTTVQRKSKSIKDPLSVIDVQLNAIYMSVQSLTEKDQEKVSKKLRKVLESIESHKAVQSDSQSRLGKESLPPSFKDMRPRKDGKHRHKDHAAHNGASQPSDRHTSMPSLVSAVEDQDGFIWALLSRKRLKLEGLRTADLM